MCPRLTHAPPPAVAVPTMMQQNKVPDTIESRVKFKDNERKFTDAWCAFIFMAAILTFFSLGFAFVGSATVTFLTGDDGILTLSDDMLGESVL